MNFLRAAIRSLPSRTPAAFSNSAFSSASFVTFAVGFAFTATVLLFGLAVGLGAAGLFFEAVVFGFVGVGFLTLPDDLVVVGTGFFAGGVAFVAVALLFVLDKLDFAVDVLGLAAFGVGLAVDALGFVEAGLGFVADDLGLVVWENAEVASKPEIKIVAKNLIKQWSIHVARCQNNTTKLPFHPDSPILAI